MTPEQKAAIDRSSYYTLLDQVVRHADANKLHQFMLGKMSRYDQRYGDGR